MRQSNQVSHPAIQARITFFERLEEDVKKASIGSELRLLYEKFGNYCINLQIANAFGGIPLSNENCDEDFRKELLSNIDMAKNVCLSTRSGLSSSQSFTINNTNQQEQNQSQNIQIKEHLRKALTGEQYDELLELINKKADKKTIAEKIKDFGLDVASGVLSAIISSHLIQ